MKIVVLLMAALALSGCATEARYRTLQDRCTARGFNPQTDAHRFCVLDLERRPLTF